MWYAECMNAQRCLGLIFFALFAATAVAQQKGNDRPELPDAPPPTVTPSEDAPVPPKKVGPDQPAPSVNIRREGNQIIEEYQLNGETYMVKITPEKGVSYYLIDTDGDGDFDTKEFDDTNSVRPVYYKLLEWK